MDNYFLNVNSNSVGGYFSSEQIDLLSIIQCSSIEELQNFISNCDQISEIYSKEQIESLKDQDLESAKRKVFKDYQDTLVYHDDLRETSIDNRLKHIGIKEEDFDEIKSMLASRDLQRIREFIELKYPKHADAILIMNLHFTSDERDQIKSEEYYDELSALNDQLSNFDTMLIGSGKIYEVVNGFYTSEEREKRFDFYKATRDLEFAYSHGKQVRFHSLLVKEDASHLFDGKSREEIIEILTDYVKASIDFVNSYNATHKVIVDGKEVPVIRTIDLFNELVSFDKNEKGEYYNIWEARYGISMADIVFIFEYAKEHKPEGVSYLYNEPFLEDPERRRKVLETLQTIDQLSPGLIDTLGSQMHITMTLPAENIRGCFADLRRLQETTGKKIQITEFDMSLGKREIVRVFGENADLSLQQVYEYKENKIGVVSQIIRDSGVHLSGVSYWSLTDGIDCNLERIRTNALSSGQITSVKQIPTACGGLIPTHKKMIKSMQQSAASQKQETAPKAPTAKKGFDQRSQGEVQIAQQIKEKNTIIKNQKAQQKAQQKDIEKPKVKVYVKPTSNSSNSSNGFVNTLIMTSVTAFAAGILFMMVYLICK